MGASSSGLAICRCGQPFADALQVPRVLLLEVAFRDERSVAVPLFRACALRASEIVGGVRFAALRGGRPVSPVRCPSGRLDVAAVVLGSPEAFLGLAPAGVRVELGGELSGAAGSSLGRSCLHVVGAPGDSCSPSVCSAEADDDQAKGSAASCRAGSRLDRMEPGRP